MNKITLFAQLSKALGYLAFALNNVLKFAGNVTIKMSDIITNKTRYDVEILVEGATTITHKNQTAAQLGQLLNDMDKFGVTEVIIKQHLKQQEKENDN
tara:strand:+ start:374 stop:667 length:294 start_codon:yes stop_codon:yes gene_type:complete